MPRQSKIGKIASAKTSKEFADELSSFTQLTSEELKALFPKKSDREALIELIKIVNSSATENEKKAKITQIIGKLSGAVLKIAKKFATGL